MPRRVIAFPRDEDLPASPMLAHRLKCYHVRNSSGGRRDQLLRPSPALESRLCIPPFWRDFGGIPHSAVANRPHLADRCRRVTWGSRFNGLPACASGLVHTTTRSARRSASLRHDSHQITPNQESARRTRRACPAPPASWSNDHCFENLGDTAGNILVMAVPRSSESLPSRKALSTNVRVALASRSIGNDLLQFLRLRRRTKDCHCASTRVLVDTESTNCSMRVLLVAQAGARIDGALDGGSDFLVRSPCPSPSGTSRPSIRM